MIVNFTKMHGLGNDFVVIDLITQGARLNKQQIARIADRKFGIGCDQVILVTPPNKPDSDFFYKIFNADGLEVEQCGNGARCAAKFFINNGLTNKQKLRADCNAGTMQIEVDAEQQLIDVNLGTSYSKISKHALKIPALPTEIYSVDVGNPHGVCIVDDISNIPILEWGQQLTNHPIFPKGANISFMQIIDEKHAYLRVFERGVGPTLACGSAACAAFLVGNHLDSLSNSAAIEFEFGHLLISLDTNKSLIMQGPANSVFIGRFRV